ncbi:hypothetical protein ONZ43_g4485 [Nemania bipapillata]|uniref:Uncharacterized protein n=1 Tax=Nemania bipapillata TaxID=110536 RepID=A0ACC2ILZ5_9PEZI|nr:hypothetical protein ONZ43_g4485 [Nemania bipapillata]
MPVRSESHKAKFLVLGIDPIVGLPNPDRAASVVINPPQGGTDALNVVTLTDNANAVTSVSVWVNRSVAFPDRDVIKAIKVTYADGEERSLGNKTGIEFTFTFHDNEKVKALSFWTGGRVDNFKLTTNEGRLFQKGGPGGSEKPQNVGNGVLIGFSATANSDELVSLGSTFKDGSD